MSTSSGAYPWVNDAKAKAPKDADHKLATGLREGVLEPTPEVINCMIERNLSQAAAEAMQLPALSAKSCIYLLSKFEDLLESFILRDDFTSDQVRDALKTTLSDMSALALLDRCIQVLEQSLEDWRQSRDHLHRYLRAVGMIIDAKFLNWYVKSSGGSPTGTRIARLAAVVSKYRKVLYQDQHSFIKCGGEEGVKTESLIRSNQQPIHDGRVFFHSLVL